MVKNKTMDLPDECWELIFERLGHHYHLDAISLVCKRFLLISSCVLHSLTISDPTILIHCDFSKLSQRFRQIKRLHVCSPLEEFEELEELDGLMVEIARSGLNIEKLRLSDLCEIPVECYQEICSNMKNLKTLTCKNTDLRDNGLMVIGSSLPKLQKLKIGHRSAISNKGIQELASKLKDLRKIKLIISGRQRDAVANASRSDTITANSINYALRCCSNLTSLSVNYYEINFLTSSVSYFENSLSYTRALCTLEFQCSVISDALVGSIVKANLPLKKLKFHNCKNITVIGLSILLHKYQSLSKFNFRFSEHLTDQDMDYLSKYLRRINHIDLSGCKKLTNSTFFLLARSCPMLVDIKMFATGLGKEGNLCVDLKKLGQVEFLDLASSVYLNDETLKRIGYICPNLQTLELANHRHITEQGICDILKSCPGIRHFMLSESKLETILGTNSEQSKLNMEVLIVNDMLNDKGMAMIGIRCPRLLKLNIMFCSELTAEGVNEVVKKCPKLMELNLRYCCNVDFDLLSSILLTRPSLRKVFSPDEYFLTEEKRNLFMRHGCRLY